MGVGPHRRQIPLLLQRPHRLARHALGLCRDKARLAAQQELHEPRAAPRLRQHGADRHGPHGVVRFGLGGVRRRFRPFDGAVPLHRHRHEQPHRRGVQRRRPALRRARLDVLSAGVPPRHRRRGARAGRRRVLQQLSVAALGGGVPPRLPDRVAVRGRRRTRHAGVVGGGSGDGSGHHAHRLRAAREEQPAHKTQSERGSARLRGRPANRRTGLRGRHEGGARAAATHRRATSARRGGRDAPRVPRPLSRSRLRTLRTRRAPPAPAILRPHVHALRRAVARHAAQRQPLVRRGARTLFQPHGHRRIHLDGVPRGALRLPAPRLRHHVQPQYQTSVPLLGGRKHILHGLQSGLLGLQLLLGGTHRAVRVRRSVPRARVVDGAFRRPHGDSEPHACISTTRSRSSA